MHPAVRGAYSDGSPCDDAVIGFHSNMNHVDGSQHPLRRLAVMQSIPTATPYQKFLPMCSNEADLGLTSHVIMKVTCV